VAEPKKKKYDVITKMNVSKVEKGGMNQVRYKNNQISSPWLGKKYEIDNQD
jgi:hypothetical protein